MEAVGLSPRQDVESKVNRFRFGFIETKHVVKPRRRPHAPPIARHRGEEDRFASVTGVAVLSIRETKSLPRQESGGVYRGTHGRDVEINETRVLRVIRTSSRTGSGAPRDSSRSGSNGAARI
jgi:hypothetical protein